MKQDVFGSVELVRAQAIDGGRVRLIRRVVTPRIGVGWLAGMLARRESKALAVLEAGGARGVALRPQLDAQAEFSVRRLPSPTGIRVDPPRVFVRPFAEGLPLHRATTLPLDFFDLLEDAARELHALGVCHNDLHKEQNIIVGESGAPVIIDFQLATRHPKRRGRWFRARCQDDLRHIQKHRRRYTRDGRGPSKLRVAESERMPRKGIPLVWMKTGKPIYKFITRKILRTRDGEEMRPSSGPWPEWVPAVNGCDRGDASAVGAADSPA